MAAKLQCEICGGKLIGRPGGIFECDSCGMEYDTAWAKAKIQEITGTVKVEGTVEVTGKVQVEGGTVQIEGAANRDSLLRRAEISLKDGDWEKARELCDQALSIDPECGEAYLLLALAHMKRPGTERLTKADLQKLESGNKEEGKAWKNAKRYADSTFREKLRRLTDETEKRWGEAEKRAKLLSHAKGMLFLVGTEAIIGIDTSGKTHVYAEDPNHWSWDLESWPPVNQLLVGWADAIGICCDGSVRVASKLRNAALEEASGWKNIRLLARENDRVVAGLKNDGTLCGAHLADMYQDNEYEFRASGWNDIDELVVSRQVTGRRQDGSYGEKYYAIGKTRDGTIKSSDPSGDTYNSKSIWDITLPFSENGCEVVSVGADTNQRGYPALRIGLNGNAWTYDYRYKKDLQYPVPDDVGIVAAECCVTPMNSGIRFACLTETGKVYYIKNYKVGLESLEWKLFDNLESIEEERREKKPVAIRAWKAAEAERAEVARKAAAEKAEIERRARIKALCNEKAQLETERSGLTGLFTGKRRREIESRLFNIEVELKKLG